MSDVRYKLIFSVLNKAKSLIDLNIHNNLEKKYEYIKQIILNNEEILTKDEKLEAIKLLNNTFDKDKILYNEGTKRICENCQKECLAISYCEYCIRNYLKENFSDWTSENEDIDNLIRKCQMESYAPNRIIEWIPYNNLRNIEYLTKGGYSEIYTADWIDGEYFKWNNQERKLKRFGKQKVILKRLENGENTNRNWFDEVKSHLTLSNKWSGVVKLYGLTKDPSDGNYILVIQQMNMDLREYLQKNRNLTWKEKIDIIFYIINALSQIHKENAIHRDLHSGNILFSQLNQEFYISDLGFCGPADKKLDSIYGNLSYIAPEVISKKESTFASDIYSIAILMWEVSSGQFPFINHTRDYYLATKIMNGMRPKIMSSTPLKYKILMEQCWHADPTKRPDINSLHNKIFEVRKLYYQNNQYENNKQHQTSNDNISKFGNLLEIRIITEAHHSQHNFSIPNRFMLPDIGRKGSQLAVVHKQALGVGYC
ncbi:kinase-like domain-containing protein [Rhizophagus irregularis DAOM 181602=DAOM 197198]|uniref:Kinase-like domain-containing protein n=1 Tax=Rhizophagus irregularis (strain DAOM 181602 / DAOM 197198 / MUCL 43194) TaxID=747089 RepID=A0A2P4PZD1_RHIID|nr:kinase-like domain-containing protein [Rhizophagus irregularis DAOM 181602=DAOM 197198]POG70728.1 kinase-like domain-containing protein [Rhizophagus irregularis DAOM 181602=DAOM 197198]|eukprot:XP_025177594.1 kinase-like domain-containing protein [Rhizophagus irregularis DAOM 181602=DAOM 197198]